jgi:hypothetical protein
VSQLVEGGILGIEQNPVPLQDVVVDHSAQRHVRPLVSGGWITSQATLPGPPLAGAPL